ncbi:MAG TPA: ATP phosphoribosyltransferase regulatory subunit [Clostridiales bacterium]|nr:ATP phosphoribosyltransferase regulatory subunit [Clostridiales bacterium]
MPKWKIYTPEGVQDILIDECYIKRNIESNIREVFRKSGYMEIETPTLEFFDTFSVDEDSTPQEMMFKFFDHQGRILVLRPDLTIPVARVAASKFKVAKYLLKIFYVGNTYRYNESGGGRQNEFTQAGVELIGSATPEADAEVIATAINALKAAGMENFQIDIGQVEFFKGLMEETGLPEQDVEQMRILIDRKDFIGIEEIINHCNIAEELKELILDLPRLFGTIDVIDRVEKIVKEKRSLDALNYLRNILGILEDHGLGKYVFIDLGMVQSLNYYTGIIFRGFTHGVGFPILSGGRYDTLVEKFGAGRPATGFSIGVNLVMNALERQKTNVKKQEIDSLICYEKEGRKTAFVICEEMRKQGLVIEMDITMAGMDYISSYAKAMNIGGIIRVVNSEIIEIYNLETGEMQHVTVSELISRS